MSNQSLMVTILGGFLDSLFLLCFGIGFLCGALAGPTALVMYIFKVGYFK